MCHTENTKLSPCNKIWPYIIHTDQPVNGSSWKNGHIWEELTNAERRDVELRRVRYGGVGRIRWSCEPMGVAMVGAPMVRMWVRAAPMTLARPASSVKVLQVDCRLPCVPARCDTGFWKFTASHANWLQCEGMHIFYNGQLLDKTKWKINWDVLRI